MAELDWIDICVGCMVPVEKSRRCPLCGADLRRICSLGFETMRTLRGKGYKPVSCKLHGFAKNKSVVVVFDGYSPGRGVHGEMRCQLDDDNRAVCSTWRERGKTESYRQAYEWAQEANPLSRNLPFNRELCEKCGLQDDVQWLHGTCQCPCAGLLDSDKPGSRGPHEFWKGFPDGCFYLAEQVMTRERVVRACGMESV